MTHLVPGKAQNGSKQPAATAATTSPADLWCSHAKQKVLDVLDSQPQFFSSLLPDPRPGMSAPDGGPPFYASLLLKAPRFSSKVGCRRCRCSTGSSIHPLIALSILVLKAAPLFLLWFYKKLKNVSCEYNRLNG